MRLWTHLWTELECARALLEDEIRVLGASPLSALLDADRRTAAAIAHDRGHSALAALLEAHMPADDEPPAAATLAQPSHAPPTSGAASADPLSHHRTTAADAAGASRREWAPPDATGCGASGGGTSNGGGGAGGPIGDLGSLERWELTCLIDVLSALGDRRDPPLTPQQASCVSKLGSALFAARLHK